MTDRLILDFREITKVAKDLSRQFEAQTSPTRTKMLYRFSGDTVLDHCYR